MNTKIKIAPPDCIKRYSVLIGVTRTLLCFNLNPDVREKNAIQEPTCYLNPERRIVMRFRVVHSVCLSGALLCASACSAQGPQQKDSQAAPPATKLEAFSAKTGVVIIRGYTKVGSVNGLGNVTIDAREFRDAANVKQRVTGLSIEVKESGRLERESISFVDYDEIDSLVQGIEYISRIDSGITQMKSFEAEYKTKGDFSITTFSSNNGISVAVSSGRFSKVAAYLKISDLAQLRTLLQNGKAAIDSATQSAK
jgi:hypothetical protein